MFFNNGKVLKDYIKPTVFYVTFQANSSPQGVKILVHFPFSL